MAFVISGGYERANVKRDEFKIDVGLCQILWSFMVSAYCFDQ